MSRIFITGSSAGLGLLAGRHLIGQGHEVVMHARTPEKARALRTELPGAAEVLVADLESMAQTRALADSANALGRFDAVIHNAGVGDRGTDRLGPDGLPVVFAVNVLAPYLLTALMLRPARLVYLGSSMHFGARPARPGSLWQDGRWRGRVDYSQTKFMDVALALAVARLWPEVRSNAVDPGWVPTRMGGAHAPDDLQEGAMTQYLLALGEAGLDETTGQYLRRRRVVEPDPAVREHIWQDEFLALCAAITGVRLPS